MIAAQRLCQKLHLYPSGKNAFPADSDAARPQAADPRARAMDRGKIMHRRWTAGRGWPQPARIGKPETAITLYWRKVYFHNRLIDLHMFSEYIEAALERAVYRTIEDEEPVFVSVPELPGAWATGKTVEEARKELISVIEGWIALRLRMGRSIPPIGGHTITASIEGPFPGSDHDYMVRGDNFVRIPNAHRKEIGTNLIAEILREGSISRDEWLSTD